MLCDENGIHRELTTPYTPKQNGVAEQKNRTVVELTQGSLKAKGLPDYFWGEVVATDVYLLNISPQRLFGTRQLLKLGMVRSPTLKHLWLYSICSRAALQLCKKKQSP